MNSHIALDHIIFSLQKSGGISRWWANHCSALFGHELVKLENAGWYKNDNIHCEAIRGQLGSSKDKVPSFWYLRSIRIPASANLFHSSYYRCVKAGGGTRIIFTFHDSWGIIRNDLRSTIKRGIVRKCMNSASAIHCVSNFSSKQLLDIFPDVDARKIQVVHHGFQRQDVLVAVEQIQALDASFVLFVGRRDGYKNGMLAISAIRKMPSVHLVFVGGGRLSYDESRIIEDAKLTERVHLINASDAELAWLYSKAVALWYPSTNEGFGFPVLEAAAQNCPVLAVGGHSVEEISDGYCVLTKNPSDDWLISETNAIIRASGNPASSAGRAKELVAKYSWDAYGSSMKELYRKLCPHSFQI